MPSIGTQNQNINASTAHVRHHIGAALHGQGDDACPPALEATTGHHAVLNAEQRQQQQIGAQGFDPGCAGAEIDRLGHEQVAAEADEVQQGCEARHVGGHAVEKRKQSAHGSLLVQQQGDAPVLRAEAG